MQKYQQFQLQNTRDVPDLMDDEGRVCDTCGAEDLTNDLIVCCKCHDGAEHTYCMYEDERLKLQAQSELSKYWTCQGCMPRKGTDKFVQDEVEVAAKRKKGHLYESLTNCKSNKGSNLKSRSLCTGKSGENGAELQAKRQEVPTIKLKSVNKIMYSCPGSSSGGAAESCEQLDNGLLARNLNTLKRLSYPDEKRQSDSLHLEKLTKDVTYMNMYELCTNPIYHERSPMKDLVQVEAALHSQYLVIPNSDHNWLGKFQMHNNEGITITCDGIQAHLSNSASIEVLQMVDRLPEIIILEEQPRMRIWPSQFKRSEITEEHIALYFFAQDFHSYICYKQLMKYMMNKDLALKGTLDGVELLIFPSNVLPKNSQCWNDMFFFWGVFRGKKPNTSTSTLVINSLKLKNGDAVKNWPFDLNVCPQGGDSMAKIDGISKCKLDTALSVGDDSSSKGGKANAERRIIDVNISPCPESKMKEKGLVGIEDKNAGAPPTSSQLSTTLNPILWEIVDALTFLSKGKS